ncbi:sugar ABC transporter ATP-binding protein [Amycolatopsis pithecellobii]|uniref:ATP-binding cassette domain-containing protein n=1 Tax=Amycolatopsis pithecellobii TaxID=664692 RepID=A0A6N7Z583_9PSEU|nr:sugar ABC transporter ATP-binding protein [Amycolatopsis pithecellobii]MTD55630.1 ATP-binding cassette domain-containing protein [Amycolatopsis pithecellobii]
MTDAAPLEVVGLSKSFGSVKALRDVDLTVRRGEVHGLVGQNGSGKSTLVKVLAGYHAPDRGSVIKVEGKDLGAQPKLRHMREAGIAIVHQDFGLVLNKSVAENIAVGSFVPARWSRRVNWRREEQVAADLLSRLESHIDPRAMIEDLSPADRSIVAIARALRNQRPGSGVIVLDESTRALPKDALEDFYRTLRGVVAAGGSALMISHNLEEIMQVTDRVTVLRDGAKSGPTMTTRDSSEAEIALLMLGKIVTQDVHTRVNESPRAPIQVRGLSGRLLTGADLTVRPGEVLGVSGVAGSGWDELPYLLTGARRASSGTVEIDGRVIDLSTAGPARCIAAGLALLPEHRIDHGLAMTLTVAENITLPRVRRRGSPWHIGRRWQRRETDAVLDGLDVRPRRADIPVGQLSGGNQQKVMLGKWLEGQPELLVLHEPTQAVDVGAREDILKAIAAIAGRGVAVVVASIQPADLAAVCNRVLIFHSGRVTHELFAPAPDDIVDAVYGGHLELQEG